MEMALRAGLPRLFKRIAKLLGRPGASAEMRSLASHDANVALWTATMLPRSFKADG
jgi:hypothetical protein